MTRRMLVLAVLSALGFLGLSGVAHAAPGDCYVVAGPDGPGTVVTCEPYPTDPNAEPPYYSICTPLPSEDIAPLTRKSCQTYLRATGEAVGDPQTFIYGESSTPTSSAPATTTTAPSTSAAPSVAPRATTTSSPVRTHPPVAPQQPARVVTRPGPASTETVTVAEPVLSPVPCVANAVRGFDGYDVALDPDNNGVSCESATNVSRTPPAVDLGAGERAGKSISNAMLYGIATVAGIVLLLCFVIPPAVRRFRPGRHRG